MKCYESASSNSSSDASSNGFEDSINSDDDVSDKVSFNLLRFDQHVMRSCTSTE